MGGWSLTGIRDLAMDVNGDGKADLVRVWHNGGGGAGSDAWAQVSLSNGQGFGDVSHASVGGGDRGGRGTKGGSRATTVCSGARGR